MHFVIGQPWSILGHLTTMQTDPTSSHHLPGLSIQTPHRKYTLQALTETNTCCACRCGRLNYSSCILNITWSYHTLLDTARKSMWQEPSDC